MENAGRRTDSSSRATDSDGQAQPAPSPPAPARPGQTRPLPSPQPCLPAVPMSMALLLVSQDIGIDLTSFSHRLSLCTMPPHAPAITLHPTQAVDPGSPSLFWDSN